LHVAFYQWLTSIGADMSDVGRLVGASETRTHRPKGGEAVGHHIIHVMRHNAIERGMDARDFEGDEDR